MGVTGGDVIKTSGLEHPLCWSLLEIEAMDAPGPKEGTKILEMTGLSSIYLCATLFDSSFAGPAAAAARAILSWRRRFPGSFADALHLAKGFFGAVVPVGLGAMSVAFFAFVAVSSLTTPRPQGASATLAPTFKARGGFSLLTQALHMLYWASVTRGLVFPENAKVSNIGHLCGIMAGVVLALSLVPADKVGRAGNCGNGGRAPPLQSPRSNTADYSESGAAHAAAAEEWQRDACGVRISHDSIEWLALIDTLREAASAAAFWRAPRPRKGRFEAASAEKGAAAAEEERSWAAYVRETSRAKSAFAANVRTMREDSPAEADEPGKALLQLRARLRARLLRTAARVDSNEEDSEGEEDE